MFHQGVLHIHVYCMMIVSSMVTAVPRYYYTGMAVANYNQAEATCRDRNAKLPAPQTWNHHEQLIHEMKENSLTTAWLRFRKTRRTKYTWVNNAEVKEGRIRQMKLSAHKRECGILRSQRRDLKDTNCAFTSYGYICRHQGTCPRQFYFYNCHYVKAQNVSFTFHCGVSNWFSARSLCEANDGELARFDSSEQVTEVLTNMKQFQGCTSFWVGFSRVSWEYQDNNVSRAMKLAPWHLWDPKKNRNCSAVKRRSHRYAWRAVHCSGGSADPVICQTSETSPSEKQAAPSLIYTARAAVNYKQAEGLCRNRRATLPAPQTLTQHQQLIDKMKENSLTTAWLRFMKTQRTKYTWVNNEEVEEERIRQVKLSARKRECGVLRVHEQDLKDSHCAFTGYGYICRFQGTCPNFFYYYNCHHLEEEDVSFTFQCGVSNWFSARSQCEANGGELARFDSSEQVNNVLTTMRQFRGCTSFWVGFSRVNWEYQDNNVLTTIKLAPWHLWEPELENNCSALTLKSERYAWQAVQCSAAHPVVCQTS